MNQTKLNVGRRDELNIKSNYVDDFDVIVHHGDSLKFLETIPDKKISLVISSPPYNIGKEYEEKMTLNDYLDGMGPILKELERILCDGGSLCWQVGNYVDKTNKRTEIFPLDIFYYEKFKNLNLQLRNRVIWHFGHGMHTKNRFSGRYETLLWFTKGDDYIFNLDNVRVPQKYPGKRSYRGKSKGKPSGNPKGKNPSDFWETLNNDWENMVWNIPNVKSNHPEKTSHQCQFPIELVERCILAMTDINDLVLDPFGGVGSAAIAAIRTGRKGISIDKEKEYTKIALERISLLERNELKIRELGTKVYEPTGKEKVSSIPKEWSEK